VDDDDHQAPVLVPNPVLSVGYFSGALPGQFSQAPKKPRAGLDQYAGIICEELRLESATAAAWPGATGVRVPRRVPWPAGTRANRIVGAAISVLRESLVAAGAIATVIEKNL
jgi:hypothetical protein